MMAGGTNTEKLDTNASAQSNNLMKRTIMVEAVGVVDVVPDECHLIVGVSSSKGTLLQAKDSVERRVQYILQAVQNSQIHVNVFCIFLTPSCHNLHVCLNLH